MVRIGFEDITFKNTPPSSDKALRIFFYDRYYFDVEADELSVLGDWSIVEGDLEVSCSERKAENKLLFLIERGLNNLTHLLYNKPAFFISSDSGVPCIGSNEFGVIDRGSNILEVKPVTGCNFNCVYCSVDEGRNNKTHDYFVELEYLVETVAWVAARKEHRVECNIGPQGEPLIYPKIVELIKELSAIEQVGVISINTNGSLLSEQLIDKLADAGLTRINLSLNAVEQEQADALAGTAYPLDRVLKMIKYCQEKDDPKINVLLAPTYVPGYNDDQLEGLVQLSKSVKSDFPAIGIQNFLKYPKGRNPVKQKSWDEFYEIIKDLEEKTGKTLKATMEDFGIHNEPELPKPFKKNDRVRVKVVGPGRYPREILCAAGSGKDARVVTVIDAKPHDVIGKEFVVKIVRDKHNIFKGVRS